MQYPSVANPVSSIRLGPKPRKGNMAKKKTSEPEYTEAMAAEDLELARRRVISWVKRAPRDIREFFRGDGDVAIANREKLIEQVHNVFTLRTDYDKRPRIDNVVIDRLAYKALGKVPGTLSAYEARQRREDERDERVRAARKGRDHAAVADGSAPRGARTSVSSAPLEELRPYELTRRDQMALV